MEPYVCLTRQKLIKRLEVEEDPDVVGQFLGHPAWQVRWAAIDSLDRIGTPTAKRYLLGVLTTTEDRYELTHASAALGQTGAVEAIPALTALIHHHVDDVKCAAIYALCVLGDASLTPVYLDALTDCSWAAKWYAMAAIHDKADRRAIPAVIDRLHAALSRDRKTRTGSVSEVTHALGFLGRWPADESRLRRLRGSRRAACTDCSRKS